VWLSGASTTGERDLVARLRELDERSELEHVLEQAGWLDLIDERETVCGWVSLLGAVPFHFAGRAPPHCSAS
jgi:hypothetical protein